jgi:hypothetical protein
MAASYPTSIKSFLTYHDQPTNPSLVVPDPDNPGQTVDLTLDRAKITNEIHDEVIAMEKTIGLGYVPTAIPGTITMGAELDALYNGKSNGRIDPSNNAIYPLPPPSHNHVHNQLTGLDADDHPQYMRVDGARGFSAPVNGQWAWLPNHLCTLGQVQNADWQTSSQVNFLIWTTVTPVCPYPMAGPEWISKRYRMTGGTFWGRTDVNGNAWIDFSAARFAGVLTFVYMKMPFPGGSAYGYAYQYE